MDARRHSGSPASGDKGALYGTLFASGDLTACVSDGIEEKPGEATAGTSSSIAETISNAVFGCLSDETSAHPPADLPAPAFAGTLVAPGLGVVADQLLDGHYLDGLLSGADTGRRPGHRGLSARRHSSGSGARTTSTVQRALAGDHRQVGDAAGVGQVGPDRLDQRHLLGRRDHGRRLDVGPHRLLGVRLRLAHPGQRLGGRGHDRRVTAGGQLGGRPATRRGAPSRSATTTRPPR